MPNPTARCSALRLWMLFTALIASFGAQAGTATLLDAGGQPLANAVVVAPGQTGTPPPGPYEIDQVDLAFVPHVLVVPVGAEVTFPNSDRTRHHVYSFSAPNQFELKLYRAHDAPPVRFDAAGVVELGCNIHDQMKGYLYVTREPVYGVSNAAGEVTLPAELPDATPVQIWHPALGAGAPLTLPWATRIATPVQVAEQPAAPKSDLRDRLKSFKRQGAESTGD